MRSRPLALGVLAATALAAPGAAQAPARWADLHVPAGVAAPQLLSQGKLVVYHDTTAVHVFSAVTREWQVLPAGAGATLDLHNDCLLLRDGAQWTAYSAYAGQAAILTVSPTAQLRNPAGQRNDSVLLVADGPTVSAFSCFTGTWSSHVLPPIHDLGVQRHVAVLAAGTTLSGFDAYTGQWHDTTVATPPLFVSCDGMAGLAVDAAAVHAFSALRGGWQSAPIPANAAFTRADDWAMFHDPTQVVAYSAVTGSFATLPFGATAVPLVADLVAVADTPVGLLAFSAPRGTFSAPLGPSTARADVSTAAVVVADGAQVTGYSAVHGAAASLPITSAVEAVADVVAVAVESGSGRPWCYSALTNSWHAAPTDALPGLPLLTTTAVLIPSTSGLYAFGARTGAFAPLSSPTAVPVANDRSAIAMAWDATHLHAFDAHTESWRSVPRTSAAPPLVQIWRTSMFVVDGATAHGFGAQAATWESTQLPEPYFSGRANSESATVVTPTHVLAHAPLPALLPYAQFPEFRRVQPVGATARFSLRLAGGGVGVVAGGFFAAAPTPVPGYGTLWLQQPLGSVIVHALPAQDRALYDLPVPAAAALVGLQLGFQALAVPAIGAPFLTDAADLYLL